jgi:maltokinase
VDQVTEFDVQSYATDARLLDELRAAWPPAEATDTPAGEQPGYVRAGLAGLSPVGAVRLSDRFAAALAEDPAAEAGAFVVVPVVRDDAWRRARPGDGLSAFVAGVPMASERAVGVDQTHDSVVVGERAIIKWFRTVGPEPSRAATLIAHLAAAGSGARSSGERSPRVDPRSAAARLLDDRGGDSGSASERHRGALTSRAPRSQDENGDTDRRRRTRYGIPRPLGSLVWLSPTGVELTLAQGDEFLPGARDGWEWCVEGVPDDASIGADLGRLVDWLHTSLATPSSVIEQPVLAAGARLVAGWHEQAARTVEQALAADVDGALTPMAEELRGAVTAIASNEAIAIQPVHGDLHVGQVLEWSGGLAVIDFDGNPTLGGEANVIRQPRERDISQMLLSIDHVGRVVDERAGGRGTAEVARWIAAARASFLDAIRPVDVELLAAFEVEQECRELVYASRFLPRWRYAPLATLRARYGR